MREKLIDRQRDQGRRNKCCQKAEPERLPEPDVPDEVPEEDDV